MNSSETNSLIVSLKNRCERVIQGHSLKNETVRVFMVQEKFIYIFKGQRSLIFSKCE